MHESREAMAMEPATTLMLQHEFKFNIVLCFFVYLLLGKDKHYVLCTLCMDSKLLCFGTTMYHRCMETICTFNRLVQTKEFANIMSGSPVYLWQVYV